MDTVEVYYSDQYENEDVAAEYSSVVYLEPKKGILPDIPEKLITSIEVPSKALKSKPHKILITTLIILAVLFVLVIVSLGTALGLSHRKVSNLMKLQTESTLTTEQYINMTFWSQTDIYNFLQITNLPALEELTVCFFYEPSQDNPPSIDSPEYHTETLISIASDENYNAFLFGFYKPEDTPTLTLAYEPRENAFKDNLLSFKEKHRHCFVWKRLHYLKWFYDLHFPGKLEFIDQIGDNGSHSIPAGSTMILLNEQDAKGGRLDSRQMVAGNIADFQMWYKALSNEEVRNLGCRDDGHLISFEHFEIIGTQLMQYGTIFECSS